MSINSASDAKLLAERRKQFAESSSQVVTTAPQREVTPITGGLAFPTTYTTTYTTVTTLQKKNESIYSRFWNGAVSLFNSIFGAEYSVICEADIGSDMLINTPIVNVENVSKDTEVLTRIGDASKPISVYCTSVSNGNFTDSSVGVKFNIFGYGVNISLGLKNTGISLSHTNDNNTAYFGYNASLCDLDVSCNAGNITSITDTNSYTIGGKASINGPFLFGVYVGYQGMQNEPSQTPPVPVR